MRTQDWVWAFICRVHKSPHGMEDLGGGQDPCGNNRGSEGQRGMGIFLKSWVGADNRRGDVDKVLGLLQCVCRRSLREMIASVGSEWRLPREISMWFGGTGLRLLGCLFVFLTGP